MYSSSRSISAEISSAGRFQFSSEKANSVSTSTPASIAPSTASRTAFIPARWPNGRGSRRSFAQRPLPSMWRSSWTATGEESVRRASDFHDLRFFRLDRRVHRLEMLVVRLLHFFLGVLLIVRRDVFGLLDPVHRVGARMTDRDAAFLGELVNDFHQLFAAFLGQGRNGDADEVAIVRRRESQIGCENHLLEGLQQTSVPRLHGEELRFRRGNSRDLRQGHLVPVRLDAHQIEQGGGRFARPHRRELPLHRFDGLIHHLLRMFDVICEGASWGRSHWTIVPTRSPVRTRAVAPGWLMLNTTMGSLFSLHNPNALASITA